MKNLKELVNNTLTTTHSGFRPCAFFDTRLDCIRVLSRDCSVLEERVNDRLTVLLDNYYPGPGRTKYVGFTIKGARHFCKQHGWDLSTSIKTSELLDALIASFPDMIVEWFIQVVAKPLIEEEQIQEVHIPDGNLTPVPA